MKIHSIFFVGDSQQEIFSICRDFERVRKNKDIEYFSRARLEEVFAKTERNKNSIFVVSFSRKNWDQELLLRLLKEIKNINPKNIILGIDGGEEKKYFKGCDAIVPSHNIFLRIGLENVDLIEERGFESDLILLTMFFSKNIERISRDRILMFFEESNWENEVNLFLKKYKKRA